MNEPDMQERALAFAQAGKAEARSGLDTLKTAPRLSSDQSGGIHDLTNFKLSAAAKLKLLRAISQGVCPNTLVSDLIEDSL